MHRASDCEELGLEANNKASLELEGVGHNADLYLVYRQSRGQYAKLDTWPAQSFGQRQSYEVVVVGCLGRLIS